MSSGERHSGANIHDDPIPWAIFRCAHDAFRTALNEMEYLLTQEEIWRKESFPTLWARYQKFAQLHSDMEDYGFFPLLDKVSNKAFSHNGFWEEHQNEVSSAMKVDRAIDLGRQSGNWSKVLEAYRIWQKQHIQHIEHEEEVWEHYLDKYGGCHQERCQFINQEVITPMDQHDHNLCLQFYSWIVRYLSTFGSIHQNPKDATVTFVRGLRSVCSAQQWARFMPAVHAVCDDSVWQFLLTNYSIHSADPVASQLFGSGIVTTDHSSPTSGRITPADTDGQGQADDRNQQKPTRASFLYTLNQSAVRAFDSFYGAGLEPPIFQVSEFPLAATQQKDNGNIDSSKTNSASHDAGSPTSVSRSPKSGLPISGKSRPKPVPARSIVASKAVPSANWSKESSRRSQQSGDSFMVWNICFCFTTDAVIEDYGNEDPLPPSPRVAVAVTTSDVVEAFVPSEQT